MPFDMMSTVRLGNGVEMPVLGLGTYKADEGAEVEYAVRTALDIGYRRIDTASLYENEVGIGRALHRSGIPREDVFLATKVWNDEQGEAETRAALERSLARLDVDYVDLYLVHWPVPATLPATWRAMERALEDGKVRAIGVCNCLVPHLERLAETAGVMPMVDQVEHHPRLAQPELRSYLQQHGIILEAWAPIMRGRASEVPELVRIAEAHGATPSQVALRWILQHGGVVIPKSVKASRIAENADIFGFELSASEMAAIDALDAGEDGRLGKHPDVFIEPWSSDGGR